MTVSPPGKDAYLFRPGNGDAKTKCKSAVDIVPKFFYILLCKALTRPVVSCGAEAWTMTKRDEKALLVFEREIFRRIYGPRYENGEWKSRTNRKLEEMSKGESIVKWIKGQRLSWLGHLERMEEDRMPKKIFTRELEGT
jgi:hypothetical protein